MAALYAEMDALETPEAKLYKALDKLEAVIQHNEAPIATWLPREYDLNLTYADENVAFSPYLTALRAAIRRETEAKIEKGEFRYSKDTVTLYVKKGSYAEKYAKKNKLRYKYSK